MIQVSPALFWFDSGVSAAASFDSDVGVHFPQNKCDSSDSRPSRLTSPEGFTKQAAPARRFLLICSLAHQFPAAYTTILTRYRIRPATQPSPHADPTFRRLRRSVLG